MKRLTAAILALLLAGLVAMPAFAQDVPRTEFVDFEEMRIDGTKLNPNGTFVDTEKGAEFEHLRELPKRTFTHKVKASVANL